MLGFIILWGVINFLTFIFSMAVEKYWFPESMNKFWNKLESPFMINGREVSLYIYPYYTWTGVFTDRLEGYLYIFPVFGIGVRIKIMKWEAGAPLNLELDSVSIRPLNNLVYNKDFKETGKESWAKPHGWANPNSTSISSDRKVMVMLNGVMKLLHRIDFYGIDLYLHLGIDPKKEVLWYKGVEIKDNTPKEIIINVKPTDQFRYVVNAGMELFTKKKERFCYLDDKEFVMEKDNMTGKEIYEFFNVNPEEKLIYMYKSKNSFLVSLAIVSFIPSDQGNYILIEDYEYITKDVPKPEPVNVFLNDQFIELDTNKMTGKELYEKLNLDPHLCKLWNGGANLIEADDSRISVPSLQRYYTSAKEEALDKACEDVVKKCYKDYMKQKVCTCDKCECEDERLKGLYCNSKFYEVKYFGSMTPKFLYELFGLKPKESRLIYKHPSGGDFEIDPDSDKPVLVLDTFVFYTIPRVTESNPESKPPKKGPRLICDNICYDLDDWYHEGVKPKFLFDLFKVNSETHNLWMEVDQDDSVCLEYNDNVPMPIENMTHFYTSPKKINNG